MKLTNPVKNGFMRQANEPMPYPLKYLLPAIGLLIGPGSAAPVVTFAADGYAYGENGAPVASRVTLVRDIADGDSSVIVSMPGTGTATAVTDYAPLTIPVTFIGDELVKTIEIDIRQDNIVELDETFGLALAPVENASIGATDKATVTIINDDSATISINDVAMPEGNGTGYRWSRFTVTLSQPVDIQMELVPNLSRNQSGEVLIAFWRRPFFASGLSHTVSVATERDDIVELDEEFHVNLVGLNTYGRDVTFAKSQGTGTILNDDQAVITLTGADVVEGDGGAPKMVFTATMDKEVDVPVSALISATAGGATAGVDFLPKSERVTVTTGGTPFEVEIIPDNLAENDETILVSLQERFIEASGRNVILKNDVNGFLSIFRILDDDFAPVANDDGPFEVVEDGSLSIGGDLGLLANDSDEDDGGGPANLEAVLKSGPARGTLALHPDGGFTYTPEPDFSGADSFTYAASDGTNESPSKTVTIDVTEEIDLAVEVGSIQSPLVAGGDARDIFTVSVTNHGPSDASGVRLVRSQPFPEDVVIAAASPSTGTFSDGVWTLDLAENATAILNVAVRAGSGAASGSQVVWLSFAVSAADQPETNPVNNSAAASASIIAAADTGVAVTADPEIDFQSGLFIGEVTVTNRNSEPIPAFRLLVGKLPADVRVYNAHGTADSGTSYLLHNRPLAPGASIILSVELFRPSLDPDFAPEYEIELLPSPETAPTPAAEGIPVTRNERLSNGGHLIEISSLPGAVYAVEYSHDMSTWTRVVPSVTAPANRLQWIDNGPPKTASLPGTVPSRYYRFVLVRNPGTTPSTP